MEIQYCYVKLNAFNRKLPLWCQRVKRGNYLNIQLHEEIVDDNES